MTEKIEIKIELSDISNKCLLKIKETTECVSRIYQAIDKLEIDIHKPLPSDELPILIDDNNPIPSVKKQKEATINWALKKGFEDFIGGLTLSFKETYKFLKIYSLSNEPKYTKTRQEIESELDKINIEIEKFHIPNFIQNIEKLLGKPLPLREEIESINKIRNCLVHRHGIVSGKDVKYSDDESLRLKWISIQSYTIINGEKHIITYEMRKKGITLYNLSHEFISNEKVFKVGEKISLNINEFNGVAATCSQFANSLFPLMPRP